MGYSYNRKDQTFQNMLSEPSGYVTVEDYWKLKKEIQEYKLVSDEREKALERREKLKDRLWQERLAFLSLLIASWSVIVYLLVR